MTFDRLFEIFIAEKETAIRPSSLATFCQNWQSLSKYIADAEIEAFGRHNARSLMTGLLGEGLAVKTVKDRMTQVKQMLRFAAAELDIDVLSTEWGLKYPPAEPRRLKRFNAADVSALVREAERCLERGISSGVPMMIALFTGMRIGEVCGLQWGDIDYREGVITVRRQVISQYDPLTRQCFEILGAPKTRSGYREIPLVPALRRMLRLHGGRDPEPDCFVVNNRPRPAAPRNVREQYDRLVARARVARVNFHGLRHTYATRLVETGGDLKTISVILGHADVTTTLNLYVHPSADAMRKIARKAFEKFD